MFSLRSTAVTLLTTVNSTGLVQVCTGVYSVHVHPPAVKGEELSDDFYISPSYHSNGYHYECLGN